MKIAVNTRFLLPNKLEGIGWYSYEVTKRLVERYPQHEFIFLFDRPFSEEFIFGENVRPVVVFPQARHPVLFYWWFEWSLPKLLRRLQADVFFSPDGFCSLRAKLPTLLVIHDICWQHFPEQVRFSHRKHYQYFMPRFANRAEHILTVSDYSKQDIIKYLKTPAEKISMAYPAGNADYKPIDSQLKIEIKNKYTDNQDYFIYLGSIHPRKNVPRLLQAFEQFKERTNSPIKLVLAGRMAWQTGEVGATLESMKHRASVVFLGYVPTDELLKVVAAAYAMVYVSLFEGFGIPIAEAMQAGVPVITSNCSSMPEVAGNAALLVDPYSVEDICSKMQQLWQQPQLREMLITSGFQQVQHFSWEKTTDGVVAAFQKMGIQL